MSGVLAALQRRTQPSDPGWSAASWNWLENFIAFLSRCMVVIGEDGTLRAETIGYPYKSVLVCDVHRRL